MDFDVLKSTDVAMNVLLYGESGGSSYNCKTLYRYWSAANTGFGYMIGRDSGSGKRFLRLKGKHIHVHGQIEHRNGHVYNHGKPVGKVTYYSTTFLVE